MKQSRDQQAGHRPAPSTGSRQEGQSWGSATSVASLNVARSAVVSRANRVVPAATVAILQSDSPAMDERYRFGTRNGNSGAREDACEARLLAGKVISILGREPDGVATDSIRPPPVARPPRPCRCAGSIQVPARAGGARYVGSVGDRAPP